MEYSYSVSTLSRLIQLSGKALLQRPALLSLRVRRRSEKLQARMQRAFKRPSAVSTTSGSDTAFVRSMFYLALFGYASSAAGATVNWDGETLIPLGLEARSELVLRMPEPITKYWLEQAPEVSITVVDPKTLTVKPTTPTTEQRLFLRGTTGKIYVAKLSTSLSYYPYVEVLDKTVAPARDAGKGTASAAALTGPQSLMIAMMKKTPPVGFGVSASQRPILKTDDYAIQATAVWHSPTITGLVAKIERQGAIGREIRFSPTEIEVVIPEFGGSWFLIGADSWVLTDAKPATNMYFVFEKL